jgi:hypothetical protein
LPNIVSFVGQLDNHAPYLTVQETFDFAFQCRTGGTHRNVVVGIDNSVAIADLDSNNFTENLTIEGLDLAHVANTFVGNDDVRGVSGGQRRRGMLLLLQYLLCQFYYYYYYHFVHETFHSICQLDLWMLILSLFFFLPPVLIYSHGGRNDAGTKSSGMCR